MLGNQLASKNQNYIYPKSNVEDIKPADDAFHGSPKRFAAEWWYYDAIFDNRYSVHIGFPTFSRKKLGLIIPNIHFYKEGEFVADTRKRYLFQNFKTSNKFPIVQLFDTKLIKFDLNKYKNNGEWIYNIKFKTHNNAVDLIYYGVTKGWKIETDFECWAVALPKANVTGEIIVNGEKMNVKGVGYHDHNWNYSLLSIMNYGIGWYWGKLRSDSFNLVWANIVKTPNRSQIIAIVNKDKDGFFNIEPKNIHLKVEKTIKSNRKFVPANLSLQIEDIVNEIPIKVDAKMELKNIHYSTSFFTHYWRYHINTSGFISIGKKKERFNKEHIMEYMSLK